MDDVYAVAQAATRRAQSLGRDGAKIESSLRTSC